MSSFEDDLGEMFGGQRPAPKSDEELSEEVVRLRAQVKSLQRAVAALVTIAEEQGTEHVRERVTAAVNGDFSSFARRHHFDRRHDEEVREKAPSMHAGSPYRGAMPRDFGRSCGVCGRILEPDDPELSLASRGSSVCVACFQRSA